VSRVRRAAASSTSRTASAFRSDRRRAEAAMATDLERFAESRTLPMATLHAFGVQAGTHGGRPALLYRTETGATRVKFTDDQPPKYGWKGGMTGSCGSWSP
jgi:hypothetical protein